MSKTDVGRRALVAEDAPKDLLTSALTTEVGDADDRPLTDVGLRYMRSVQRELSDAALG